jgi:hypothetical protein
VAPTPWIDYAAATYDLESNEGREVRFTVTVPEDAAPGNYVSVLVLQTVEAIPVAGTELLDQIIQKAIAIDITEPGDAKAGFDLGVPVYDESSNVPVLTIPLENSGDLRLRPPGSLTVTDASGNAVVTSDIAMDSVIARTSTTIELVLQQPLASADYLVDVSLVDAQTGTMSTLTNALLAITSATPAAQQLVTFTDGTVVPLPDAASPQFASITGTIANGGEPIASARVTLVALQDSKEIERFALIPSLSVPQGETAFEQRNIPISGSTSGTWTFQLILEAVDSNSGVATVLVNQDLEGSIVVP